MKHVDQRIQAYCDDELTVEERASVEAHLRECAACREELELARRLWDVVADGGPPELARPLWSGVADRLDSERAGPVWTWPQRGMAVAAAAAGIVIGFGLAGPATGDAETSTAAVDYLEESLPSLDQLWLQLGDVDEEAGS